MSGLLRSGIGRITRATAGALVLAAALPAQAQPADQASTDRSEQATPLSEKPAQAPVELDQEEVIVVTGSRAERPLTESAVATEVITRAEIESSGATNVAEVLEEHPSLDVVPVLRGSAVRMQGLDPAYVAVLIDGQRTIGRLDGSLDLERLAASDIERIEIVKGASSALYGSDALAGVINIITRRPEKPLQAEASARYGSLGAMDVSATAGARQRGWTANVSAGWQRGDGYDLSPEDVATTADAYDNKHAATRIVRTQGAIEVTGAADYLRQRLTGVALRAGGAIYDHENAVESAAASLATSWKPAKRSALTATLRYSLYRDQRLDDQRNATAGDTYEETNEGLAELMTQYDGALGQRHQVTAGVEGGRETLSGARIREDASERYRVAAYTQDEILVTTAPLVSLVAGGRLDLDTQFGIHATPKLALRWDPHEAVTTRVSYGWGYRAPSFKELYLTFENPSVGYRVDGNPDLEPETSQSVNAGVEVRAHRRLWASASVYYNYIDSLIIIDLIDEAGPGMPMGFAYVNADTAHTRGTELALRAEPLAGLTAKLGYTFTDTRDHASERALPGRARHRATFELGYERGASRITARAALVGSRAYFQDLDDGTYDTITTDPYATLDFRIAHTIRKRATLFLGGENLLDEGDPVYLPIAPRNFYAGVTATY